MDLRTGTSSSLLEVLSLLGGELSAIVVVSDYQKHNDDNDLRRKNEIPEREVRTLKCQNVHLVSIKAKWSTQPP